MTYLDHYDTRLSGHCQIEVRVVHSWREHTRARLEWLYGPERAALIDAGLDPKSLADVAAWNALGKRSAA